MSFTWFAAIASDRLPEQRVVSLSDSHLAAAVTELLALKAPNDFQSRVFALVMTEAVRRWIGLYQSPDNHKDE